MTLIFGKTYNVQAVWGPRAQTPDALARRFTRLIDALRDIDPLFKSWIVAGRNFDTLRPRCAEYIASKISKDDFGEIDEIDGYWFGAYTKKMVSPRTYSLHIHAGSTYPDRFVNDATLLTSMGAIPAPETITYAIFKPALLAMVEAWTPALCFAYPHELLDVLKPSSYFRANWMLYLGPRFAPLVAPPKTAINERLPDGGLLMSATTETFRVDNPRHMAVAHDIGAAVAHLDEKTPTSGLLFR
ncbi:MAG: Imm52 family immunity protein [Beijerinckiaceae bacterium]